RAQDMTAQRERAAKRWDTEPISIPRLMAEIETALPPDAIVVDEAITASIDMARAVSFARPGDSFGARGGGIGQGLPGALGVTRGMGVPAARVTRPGDLAAALTGAFAAGGPYLLDVVIEGKR